MLSVNMWPRLVSDLLVIFSLLVLFFKAVEDAFVPVIKFKFDGIEVSGLHQQAHTFCSVSVFSVRQ